MKIAGVICPEKQGGGPIIYRGDIEESIKKLADLGYQGVEISLKEPSQVDKAKLLKILDREGISLSAVATGQAASKDNLTFTSPHRKIREAAIKRINEQIEFASQFQAAIIVGLVRGNLPQSSSNEHQAINWAIDACRRCADFAGEKEVDIVFEVINRYELNWLNSIAEGKDFLGRVNKKNVFLHIDTFHMNIEEVSFQDSILGAKDCLGYVHFADSNRQAPGYGHIDFKQVISALKEVRYEGFLSFEVLPLPNPDAAARKGIETISKILEGR